MAAIVQKGQSGSEISLPVVVGEMEGGGVLEDMGERSVDIRAGCS